MDSVTHDDKTFENVVYAGRLIRDREFHNCIFIKCDLSDSSFLHNKFIDCIFEGCNLSMMKLGGSSLINATFKNCKILGVNFSDCHDFLFSVSFEGCILDYASFNGKKMLKTKFNKSSLREVGFSQANLAGSTFNETDLTGAVFNRTDLSTTNFVTAINYSIDPELNTIKKASFSAQGLAGLLDKYGIKIV